MHARGEAPRALKLKHLNLEQQEDMTEAMIKPLEEHFQHAAVSGVRTEEACPKEKTLPSRILLTNKL